MSWFRRKTKLDPKTAEKILSGHESLEDLLQQKKDIEASIEEARQKLKDPNKHVRQDAKIWLRTLNQGLQVGEAMIELANSRKQ